MAQQIQWFPGHMHKARKAIREGLTAVDLFIELLDARIPFSSQNPMLEAMRGGKPCLKVLMKSDLSDPQINTLWKAHYQAQETTTVIMTSIQDRTSVSRIPHLCHEIYRRCGGTRLPLTAMVVGIPNVGKSSLINRLVGKAIAKTGDEPAITRMQQQIRLDEKVLLLDTPGVLWPNVENRHSGFRLAVTGAIRDTAISHEDVAVYAADYLIDAYPRRLQERYGLITLPQAGYRLIEDVGRKRGCLKRGGKVDKDRAAKILLTEIRDGSLGGLTFETPEMMYIELAETEKHRREKQAWKLARKARRKQSG